MQIFYTAAFVLFLINSFLKTVSHTSLKLNSLFNALAWGINSVNEIATTVARFSTWGSCKPENNYYNYYVYNLHVRDCEMPL